MSLKSIHKVVPMRSHYSMEACATVYDEEAMTALELAGRTAAKMNETVEAYNELADVTNTQLAAQTATIKYAREVEIPQHVEDTVDAHIESGAFREDINLYAGDLTARVDNLLGSVTTGSTTMDAEIIDARMDISGTAHDNLGTAIRDGFQHVENRITSLSQTADFFDWTGGSYVMHTSGNVIAHTSYSLTDFIRVCPAQQLWVNTYCRESAGIAFYDGNRVFVSGISNVNTIVPFYHSFTVPDGAYYMRISCLTEQLANFYLTFDFTAAVAPLLGGELEKRVEQLGDSVPLTWVDGYYVGGNGDEVEYTQSMTNSYSHTDYVPVLPNAKLYVRTYMQSNAAIAYYDAGKNLLGTVLNRDVLVPYETTLTTPENCYFIRMSCRTNAKPIAYVRVGVVEHLRSLQGGGDNPIANVQPNSGGFTSIFHNMVVIGDSLASGEHEYKVDGVTKYIDLYDYSWGKCIERACGNNVTLLSKGGMTAKTWWANFASQLPTTMGEAYIIGLGVNDMSSSSFTLGTVDDIKTSWSSNADTFYGNYGKIVQRILEVQPRAKIFVVTRPHKFGATVDANHLAVNDAIRAIAEKFGCYVIDLYANGAHYFNTTAWKQQYMLETHMNTAGYQWCAWMMMQYIDRIVRENLEDFAQAAFIGTNYEY